MVELLDLVPGMNIKTFSREVEIMLFDIFRIKKTSRIEKDVRAYKVFCKKYGYRECEYDSLKAYMKLKEVIVYANK